MLACKLMLQSLSAHLTPDTADAVHTTVSKHVQAYMSSSIAHAHVTADAWFRQGQCCICLANHAA